MLNAVFRPVEKWPAEPTPDWRRRQSPFRAKYAATLDLLESELGHLKAKDVVIQAYFDLREIRNDGWPRSSARPSKPGVIVSFESGKDSYSYPCDRFRDWEDNLRAIALSLKALRDVNRYGVTQGHEQYQGFKRLPSAASSPTDHKATAYAFMARHSGMAYDSVRSDPEMAYRAAARTLHPDRGGSHDLFVQLQQHYQAVKAVHA